MPRGTESAPRTYAKLVAKELCAIAKANGQESGRAIAKFMNMSEPYVRARTGDAPTASFTVTDVERFCRLVRISPADFLGDPAGERKRFVLEIERAKKAVSSDIHTDPIDGLPNLERQREKRVRAMGVAANRGKNEADPK